MGKMLDYRIMYVVIGNYKLELVEIFKKTKWQK